VTSPNPVKDLSGRTLQESLTLLSASSSKGPDEALEHERCRSVARGRRPRSLYAMDQARHHSSRYGPVARHVIIRVAKTALAKRVEHGRVLFKDRHAMSDGSFVALSHSRTASAIAARRWSTLRKPIRKSMRSDSQRRASHRRVDAGKSSESANPSRPAIGPHSLHRRHAYPRPACVQDFGFGARCGGRSDLAQRDRPTAG